MAVSIVTCLDQPITSLWDSVTLVNHDLAIKLGFKGTDTSLSMTKITNVSKNYQRKEYSYMLSLVDKGCMERSCREISSELENVDISTLLPVFEGRMVGVVGPHGKNNLLIGIDYCELLPTNLHER